MALLTDTALDRFGRRVNFSNPEEATPPGYPVDQLAARPDADRADRMASLASDLGFESDRIIFARDFRLAETSTRYTDSASASAQRLQERLDDKLPAPSRWSLWRKFGPAVIKPAVQFAVHSAVVGTIIWMTWDPRYVAFNVIVGPSSLALAALMLREDYKQAWRSLKIIFSRNPKPHLHRGEYAYMEDFELRGRAYALAPEILWAAASPELLALLKELLRHDDHEVVRANTEVLIEDALESHFRSEDQRPFRLKFVVVDVIPYVRADTGERLFRVLAQLIDPTKSVGGVDPRRLRRVMDAESREAERSSEVGGLAPGLDGARL